MISTKKILRLKPNLVTKPIVRNDKDEDFLEKVNLSLDSEYVSRIEQAGLKSLFDNFHNFFAGATHLNIEKKYWYEET